MPGRFDRCSFFLTSMLLVSTATTAAPANRSAIANNYGKLPLAFEANRGQADDQVKFIARGSGYGLFLTGQEAVLALQPAKNDVIRMQLSGANPAAQPLGIDRLPGTANYFIGSDSSKWHTAIPTFSKAKFSHVYPGVDVVYYGNQRQLEFDFVVAPDADPKAIRLHFAGARRLKLTPQGDLSLLSRKGRIAFHKPLVYQNANGRREPIEGRFVLEANNSVSFALGGYNHSQPLIIDPVLAYATYLGGSKISYLAGDQANAIAVDSSGNAYVAGLTYSADFPVAPGAFQATNNDSQNAFVTKLDPTGKALIYSTYLGGSGSAQANGIALDGSGNAYIAGAAGDNFPVTPGAFQANNKNTNQGTNVFVTKLDSSGAALLYSTYLGGSGYIQSGDQASGIAIDGSGNAYVTGQAFSVDFPLTPGAFQTTNKVKQNPTAFVSELNGTGTALIYSTYLGGSNYNLANTIAVDGFGNAYVAGTTFSTDFPVTPGAFQTTNTSASDAFITKLNPTGTALVYSTFLGGRFGAEARAIALDDSGNAFVTGFTRSPDFPVTMGAFQTTIATAFVTKMNSEGSELIYSTYLGGSRFASYTGINDHANAIALNSVGEAYIAGYAATNNFPVTPGAFQGRNPNPFGSPFMGRLNQTGSALIYCTYLDGSGPGDYYGPSDNDQANGIALDGSGNAYIAGFTSSSSSRNQLSKGFPVTPGAFQTENKTLYGGNPATTGFVARFNVNPAATPRFSPAPGKYIGSVTVTLQDTTPNSTIRYALNNGNPTATSPLYTAPITISSGYVTVRAVADSPDKAPSAFADASYSIVAQTPEPAISPASGSYAAGQKITITDANSKATIRYTTDGSTPTANSKWYAGLVVLNSSETIRAIAFSTDDASSAVASASYTVH